jgi:hypothetical protein
MISHPPVNRWKDPYIISIKINSQLCLPDEVSKDAEQRWAEWVVQRDQSMVRGDRSDSGEVVA